MFQSYYEQTVDYSETTGEYRSQITIIDDDFTERIMLGKTFGPRMMESVVETIINVYSSRNLNVAKNLWLLHEHCNQHLGRWNERITQWQQYVPEYAPYHDEVLFYLTFS